MDNCQVLRNANSGTMQRHISINKSKPSVRMLLYFLIMATISFGQSANIPLQNVSSKSVTPILAKRLQTILDKTIKYQGVSAAVILPNGDTWVGASGYSSSDSNIALTPSMVMGIGSITKSFTAATIMRLVEEGKLSLSDSIHKFLPKYANIDSNITIRQLLNMTAGIDDYMNSGFTSFFNNVLNDPTRIWTPQEVITFYVKAPSFVAGSSWGYSNTNYVLLGMIIEKLTKNTYQNNIRSRFFTPFGLTHTYLMPFESSPDTIAHEWFGIPLGSSLLMDAFLNRSRNGFYSQGWAAGAIFSTPENTARWIKSLMEGKVVSASSFKEMTSFVPAHAFEIFDYGFGLFRSFIGGKEFWGNTGGTLGYLTTMYYVPKDSVALSVFCNSRDLRLYETATLEISAQLAIEAEYFHKASPRLTVNIDTSKGINFGGIDYNTPQKDTSIILTNRGFADDSVYINFDYQNVNIPSAISLSDSIFVLPVDSSKTITIRIKTSLLVTSKVYKPKIQIRSKNIVDTSLIVRNIEFSVLKNANHVQGLGDGTVSIMIVDKSQTTDHLYRMTIDDSSFANNVYTVRDITLGGTVKVLNAGPFDGITPGPLFDGLRLVVGDAAKIRADVKNTKWVTGSSNLEGRPYLFEGAIGSTTVTARALPYDYTITLNNSVIDTSIAIYEIPAAFMKFQVKNVTKNRKTKVLFMDGDGNNTISSYDELHILEPDSTGTLALSWGIAFYPSTPNIQPVVGDQFYFKTLKPFTSADVFEFSLKLTSVAHNATLTDFYLAQNYPNPFNPTTVISYQLPVISKVSLKIYDLLGREVVTLVNEEQSVGWKEVEWNAGRVSSGIYFYQLTTGSFVEVKKMMVLK